MENGLLSTAARCEFSVLMGTILLGASRLGSRGPCGRSGSGALQTGCARSSSRTARPRRRNDRGRRSASGRSVLVVKRDHFLRHVDAVGGKHDGSILRTHIGDQGNAVVFGVLVKNGENLLAKFVQNAALFLIQLGLCVFYLPVEALGLRIDLALQTDFLLIRPDTAHLAELLF